MSLLSAVLQEAEKATTDDYEKHLDELLPKVKELTDKIQMFSWALEQNFIDTYVNFTPTKSLEQLNYRNRKDTINSDLSKLEKDIENFIQKFGSENEFSNQKDKLNKSIKTLKDISTVVEGKRVLELANHEFRRLNSSEAITSVKKLQTKIKDLKFEGNAAKALLNLIAQIENHLVLYTAELSLELEDIFSWSEKESLNHLTYSLSVEQSDLILMQKVLKTLYVTERLNAEFGIFSQVFIDKIVHNVIRHNCEIFTEDNIGAIVFNIKIDIKDPNRPNYQTIFNNLTAIFEFLQSTLGSQLNCDKNFMEVFAESIKGKFFSKIIEDCIRNNLPSCDSSYQNYLNLVIELDSFNKFLIDLKFVEADNSPLNEYVNDTECVLYKKKCDKLLSDVRDLLNQSLSYGTIIVGCSLENSNNYAMNGTKRDILWDLDEPLFLPKCVISENVKKIMLMIVEHLEESAKLPEKYSNQLIYYIKDIAVMYQSIVPKKFKVNFEYCPLDIALFFNNCYYLTHGLIGPPWKNSLPFNLAHNLNMILLECIQDLRVLGLEKISLYLQDQKSAIMKNIEPSELTPWTRDTYETFDSAINSAISLMKSLQASWHNILPAAMYEMSLCTLIETVCQSTLQRIFADGRPISEELVYMLAVRLQDTVGEIVALFEEPIEFDKKISVWTKFVKMPQLLKAQLLEISELWNQTKELSKCYSCEEIRQIVKMRFSDNKYRLKILKEIQ